jgi:hypothetical protein
LLVLSIALACIFQPCSCIDPESVHPPRLSPADTQAAPALKHSNPCPSTSPRTRLALHRYRIRRVPHTCSSFLLGRPHIHLPVPSPPAFSIREAAITPLLRPLALPPARFRLPASAFPNTPSCAGASASSAHTSTSTCAPHVWDAEVTVCVHIAHFADAPPQREAAAAARACFASVVAPVLITSEKGMEEDAREEVAKKGGGEGDARGGEMAAVAVADTDG